MKMIQRMFQLNLKMHEAVALKKIMASVMLPIFLLQMTSCNLILANVARAAEGETVFVEEVKSEEIKLEEPKVEEVKIEIPKVAPTLVEAPKNDSVTVEVAKEMVVEKEPVAEIAESDAPLVQEPILVIEGSENSPTAETAPIIVEESVATSDVPTITEQSADGAITPEAASTDSTSSPQADSTSSPQVASIEAPEKEVWSIDGQKAVTNNPVELGKVYVAPQNEQVTVTFTKLPENPGTLSIEEITLSDKQVAELGALSNKAYDITSNMTDGTFAYELTLPKPKDEKNVQIKFAEDVAGLKKAETMPNEYVDINNENVSTVLDHFTVFIIAVHTGTVGMFMDWSYVDCSESVSADKYVILKDSTSILTSPSMNFDAYNNPQTLTFDARTYEGVVPSNNIITVSISTDGGASWSVLGSVTPVNSTMATQAPFDLSAYDGTSVKLKMETLGADGTRGAGIDNIKIQGEEFCGNGLIEAAETCDDKNIANGDGCSAVCAVEPEYSCAGEPSVCTDVTAPVGGSISYTPTGHTNALSVDITYNIGTDSASGLKLSSGRIQRRVGDTSGMGCSGWGAWSNLVFETDGSYTDNTIQDGKCYRYRYFIVDNAVNVAVFMPDPITTVKVDRVAPVISGTPANIIKEMNSFSGAKVSFVKPTALDAVSGSVPVSCTPPSASIFPYGATTVTCSATDDAGNSSSSSFTVTVQDTTGPFGVSIAYPPVGFSNEAAINITYNVGNDFSGVDLATGRIQRRMGDLSGGICAWGTWNFLAFDNDGSYTDSAVMDGKCYQYRYIIRDILGNQTIGKTAGMVGIDRTAPSVDAGTDKYTNADFSQDATASDGTSGIATYLWEKVSGPGTVTFGTPNAEDTTVSVDVIGNYVLRLTVTDQAGNSATDEFTKYRLSEITAHKFNDYNANGTNDDEADLSGWPFRIYEGADCQGSALSESAVYTDENGNVLFGGLLPGNYSVKEENVPANWRNTTGLCQNISVLPGEDGSVEFGNQELATITIQKVTDDRKSDETFWFSSSFGSNFLLGNGGSHGSGFIVPGSYSVTEQDEDGWDLKSIVCTDSDLKSATFVFGATVNFVLNPGENVSCTFTNKDDKRKEEDDNGGGGNNNAPFFGLVAGRTTGGGFTPGNETEEAPESPAVQNEGNVSQGQVQGAVAGEETACQSWPMWAWILMLVVYGGAFNYRSFSDLIQQKQRRWFVQLLLSLGAVIFWYSFDTCGTFGWFPIMILLGGAASFIFYLYKFGRRNSIA